MSNHKPYGHLTDEQIEGMSDSEKLSVVLSRVGHLYEAFPNSDVRGHCAYHDAKIRAAVAEEEFWKELKLDIAKKGAWGLLLIITGLLILGLAAKIGLPAIGKP